MPAENANKKAPIILVRSLKVNIPSNRYIEKDANIILNIVVIIRASQKKILNHAQITIGISVIIYHIFETKKLVPRKSDQE